jgi:alpha-tubulin suppressor-like RCC1 family protein
VQVSGLSGITAIGVRLAVDAQGRVWQWGPRNYPRQDNSPVLVPGLSGVTAVAQNNIGTDYALRNDGTAWAWGTNDTDGELGDGGTCPAGQTCYADTPVQVSGLSSVTGIAGGDVAGYAVRSDGTMWAWGGGQDGVLGDGNQFSQSSVPVQITSLSGVTAIGQEGYAIVGTP